jgi:hypothetical protein
VGKVVQPRPDQMHDTASQSLLPSAGRRVDGPAAGYLAQLTREIHQSPIVQAQLKTQSEIEASSKMQAQARLSQVVNGGASRPATSSGESRPAVQREGFDDREPAQREPTGETGMETVSQNGNAHPECQPQAGRPVVQRVISVKGGATYRRKEELPVAARENVTVEGYATSADKYLIASAADVVKRAQGEKPPMLTPHRHLIGELHNASRFEEAIATWGWGADKMAEGFRTSTLVKDELSDENRTLSRVGLVTNSYYGTQYLDNLHAAALHDLASLRAVLSTAKALAGILKDTAADIANNVGVDANKALFSRHQGKADDLGTNVKAQWNAMNYVSSYKRACDERLKTARGEGNAGPALLHDMASGIQTKWSKLDKNIKYFGERPYGVFDSWPETRTALGRYEANATDFIDGFIDVFASHLVKLTQAEAATLPGDVGENRTAIAQGWETAKGGPDFVHAGGSAIRELFMVKNINTNLTKPGLVLIGSQHVTNLAGKITDGKYHASYEKFVEDTES